MSLCCPCPNSQPPNCNYTVVIQPGSDVQLTFQNQNLLGVGVLDNVTDSVVGFRGITSGNAALLSVTLDAGNKAIVLDLDLNALAAALPAATTTQAGVLETATDAEAIAKGATDKILTPSNLAALTASTTFSGTVELATNAETQAGLSSTLAVTPAGLASVTTAIKQTTTFADAAARNGATPAFDGQLGAQLDNDTAWIANTVAAGAWNPLLTLNTSGNQLTGNTTLDCLSGSLFIFAASDASGGGPSFEGRIDFGTSSFFSINAVNVPADSLLGTDGVGLVDSHAISGFLSDANTQTGYTTFANPATIRTCDTGTVTLQQLAQLVGTLIEDLKAKQLPAT